MAVCVGERTQRDASTMTLCLGYSARRRMQAKQPPQGGSVRAHNAAGRWWGKLPSGYDSAEIPQRFSR